MQSRIWLEFPPCLNPGDIAPHITAHLAHGRSIPRHINAIAQQAFHQALRFKIDLLSSALWTSWRSRLPEALVEETGEVITDAPAAGMLWTAGDRRYFMIKAALEMEAEDCGSWTLRDHVMGRMGLKYYKPGIQRLLDVKFHEANLIPPHMSPSPFELPEIDTLAVLLPAFDFDCLIAHGGMGAVYKARQRSLDRDVAIKILPRELGEDPLFRESFQAEARAMARLSHPNLIRVFDFGDLDGLLYIVMEYVPGKSLFHSAHRKAIDPQQAVEIVLAACLGLAHAHDNGIVHRDIKPANILLTPKREPKIGDFGLARCTRTNAAGLAMGTPGFVAPEVINHPGRGDRQSDVFAIGVVLRELLTGIPAGTAEAANAVVSDPVLATICRTATHADPASRYPDAIALADQLKRWMTLRVPKGVVFARKPEVSHPKPVLVPSRGSSTIGEFWKRSAVIAFLLCAIGLMWNVYQNKLDAIARQQQETVEKPAARSSGPNPSSYSFDSTRNLLAARSKTEP